MIRKQAIVTRRLPNQVEEPRMRARSNKQKGRPTLPVVRPMPKMPQRPIAPPRRIPPKGR
ncbi:hypothetical protein GCM10009850_105680 [Nonomuraea monospora]|uniref:Uncharacterized protein n=1 Tax=Nonomuraea monospora TaxID=568818 RepID=A0ABN3D002_9ACTN